MKLLRNIGLLALSICLTASATLAFWSADAAEDVQITSPSSGGTSITAQTVVVPTPNFTVSIPTGISLGSIERTENEAIVSKEFSVGVSGFSNLEGKQVKVTLSTPYNAFHMYCGDHVLPYEVYNSLSSNAPIEIGGEFYTFTSAETVTGNIKVDRYDIPAPGEYGGILTFTFHVEDQPTQS